MTATAAEALELALWLHRVPARRAALLGRPLPDGIGQLLRVAIGTPDQVAAAALITGAPEGTILEAVRFYLQQILFHEDADAYRVLGLAPGATHAQAREHHRLLQQWLHPDRSGQDAWETVYASRINRAWGHLRTPQARAAYDASLGAAAGQALERGSSQGGDYQGLGRPVLPSPGNGSGNRSRNLTIVVLLGCVGLLFLVATRRDEPPQWRDGTPMFSDTAGSPRGGEGGTIETLGAAFVDAIEPEAKPAILPAAPPMSTPEQVPAPVETTPATTFAGSPVAQPGTPVSASVPPTNVAAPRPAPAAPVQAVAFVARTPPQVAVLAAPALPKPALPRVDPDPPAPVVAAALLVPATSTPPIPDAFERMNQAQARARQVVAYLGDRTAGAPAVWNDLRTVRQAEQIRTALHGRHGDRRTVRLDLRDPQWRLTADGARLESRYRAGKEQGSFGLDFTWRERQLLVRAVSLVPDA